MIELVPLTDVQPGAVESLLDRAFGPGRHARTAYAIRGGATAIPSLSIAGVEHGVLIGSIQCWPVLFTDDAGARTTLVMIGPVAVTPERQRDGIGRRLMERALDAAHAHTLADALMLIGDPDYYGRFFGFTAERTGAWRLPGPVERHRLLARGAAIPTVAGTLSSVVPLAATA